jgi:hypothetical protein
MAPCRNLLNKIPLTQEPLNLKLQEVELLQKKTPRVRIFSKEYSILSC